MIPANQAGRRWLLLEIGLLLAVLIAAACLRLSHNPTNPGWYADEGTHLLIAQNLASGRQGYMALGQSTLLLAKMPLFEGLLALLLRWQGTGMAALRQLTGLLGVLTVAVLYGICRRISGDRWLALTAAGLLAGYRQAVLYSRFGFSYNLIAPLLLLVYLGLWEYWRPGPARLRSRRRWLALAALAIGLGCLSDLWMLTLAPLLLGLVLARQWPDLGWGLPGLVLPPALYVLWMQFQAPQSFWFDLAFTFSRASGAGLAGQMRSLFFNYTALFTQDQWLALSLVGLGLMRPLRLSLLTGLLLLFPILLIGRAAALVNLSAYYMIPLFPLIALGVAVLLRRGLPWAAGRALGLLRELAGKWQWLGRLMNRPAVSLVLTGSIWAGVLLLALSPFLGDAVYLAGQVNTTLPTAIDPFLLQPADAVAVAAQINQRAAADDLVIVSPGIAWLLQTRTADPQLSLAHAGQSTPHFPADIPPGRFLYDPDYQSARFVVIDNYWRNWFSHNAAAAPQMIADVEQWPLLFSSGAVELYCNPAKPGC